MKKMTINGVEFCDFGANNYSFGMHLVSAYPMPDGMVKDVLDGKFPGVYLNPSAPCSDEFFGVFGTQEQFSMFYKTQRDSQISAKMLPYLRLPLAEFNEKLNEFSLSYKDWWEESA